MSKEQINNLIEENNKLKLQKDKLKDKINTKQ